MNNWETVTVFAAVTLALLVWSWSFFHRPRPAAATRYVRIVNDPSETVYRVVGPAPLEGFLAVETTDPDGGPLVNVAESLTSDVHGFDITTFRQGRIAERAARAAERAKKATARSASAFAEDEEEDDHDEPPPRRVPSTNGYREVAVERRGGPIKLADVAGSSKVIVQKDGE